MAYICDIVIAVLVLAATFFGYRRGLVKTAFGCLSFVAAIAISYFFGSYVGDYIKTTGVYDSLSQKATVMISEHFDEAEKESLEKAEQSFREFENSEIGKTLERLGLETHSFYAKYEMQLNEGTESAKERFAVDAAGKIIECLANALGVLVTFVVSLIVLKILAKIFDGIFRLPVLNAINRTGGVIFGVVLGFAMAYVLCMAVEILLPYIPGNRIVYPGMQNDTVLYNFFVNLNPVIFLLFG